MTSLGKRKYSGPWAPTITGSVARMVAKKKAKKSGVYTPASVATVRRMISRTEELKYFDVNIPSTSVDFNGEGFALSDIPQGSTGLSRVGDECFLKRLEVDFCIQLGTSPNQLRVIVYQWVQMSDASHPVPADIIENLGSAIAPYQPYQFTNRKKINVLRDKRYVLETAGPTVISDRFVIKSGLRQRMIFSTGSTTLKQNGLFMLAISDDGAVTYPKIFGTSRVIFSDA